jgi:hypothetical protein
MPAAPASRILNARELCDSIKSLYLYGYRPFDDQRRWPACRSGLCAVEAKLTPDMAAAAEAADPVQQRLRKGGKPNNPQPQRQRLEVPRESPLGEQPPKISNHGGLQRSMQE